MTCNTRRENHVLGVIVVSLMVLGGVWSDCSRCAVCKGTSGLCASCPAGFWGYMCDHVCSTENCADNTCDQFSGFCKCKSGYYSIGVSRGQMCFPCPKSCVECQGPWGSPSCTSCTDGKFGANCDKDCSPGCAKCVEAWSGSDVDNCLECLPGFYGISSGCAFNCSHCRDGLCSEEICMLGCADGYANYQSGCVRCFPSCKSCNSSSFESKRCLSCPSDKWGDLCNKTCSVSCRGQRCNQETGACECKAGFYLDEHSSCGKCPSNCLECNSATECILCSNRTYGDICQHQCNKECLTCELRSDRCTKCTDGYFLRNNHCHPCSEGCSECTWANDSNVQNCTFCSDGYFKDKVKDSFVFECLKCSPGCSRCDINGRDGHCQSCIEGYFPYHKYCCPNNCTSCSVHRRNVVFTVCDDCKQGNHGTRCEYECNENCLTCEGHDACITCKPGRYSISSIPSEHYCECSTNECAAFREDGNCSVCKAEGWYPRKADCCQCPNCKDLKCDENGNCLNGCTRHDQYGAKCDKPCNRALSNCWNCSGQTDKTVKCHSCVTDFHYVSDGKCVYCPAHCEGSRCGEDGVCHSCSEGWAGDQCSIECGGRCNTTCSQSGCPQCKPGYFGEFCQELCSPFCGNNTEGIPACYMNGSCHECINGYWGKTCNQSCSDGCLHSVCDMKDGRCTEGCVIGFHGHQCVTAGDGLKIVSGPHNSATGPSKDCATVLLSLTLSTMLIKVTADSRTASFGTCGL